MIGADEPVRRCRVPSARIAPRWRQTFDRTRIFPSSPAHRDERLVAELEGHEVAGLRHFVAAADADPFLAKEMLALELQNGGVGVVGLRHRPGLVIVQRLALLQRRAESEEFELSCMAIPLSVSLP